MCFFVFSINFARTREGRPARRKLTELLVKSEKILSPIPPPSFLFFKSIFHVRLRLLSFTSSMLHLVWAREGNDKTLTPTLTGMFLMTASDWEFCATGKSRLSVLANLSISQFQLRPSPPPPGQLRGICTHCQSRGSGISLPKGYPRAFDTHVVSDSKSKRSTILSETTSSLSLIGLSVKDWTKLWRFLKVCFLDFRHFIIV